MHCLATLVICGSAPIMPQPGCINDCIVSKGDMHAAGHTASWGRGYPDLLADCYNASGARTGAGPLDPTRNGTYGALWRLLREAAGVFPDAYVHLGGDEVDLACWEVCASGFRVYSVLWDAHVHQMWRTWRAGNQACAHERMNTLSSHGVCMTLVRWGASSA